MTDRENLPTNAKNMGVSAATKRPVTLVARGMVAIRNATTSMSGSPAASDSDYRRARIVYDLMTDNGGTSWVGERIGREWIPLSDLENAFSVFQRLARDGYGKAYYPLSTLHSGEQLVPGDKYLAQHFSKLAHEWCLANSNRNDPEIWNDLGICYLHEDNYQAVHWFRKAAEHGHAWGLLNLAMMYSNGWSVEEDHEESLRFQIEAAEQGNLVAILRLAQYYGPDGYRHDDGDDEQALYWYRKAAEQGYPWTEADFGAERFFELGFRYRYGDYIDDFKAEEYFTEAANLDSAEAQYELAHLLAEKREDVDSEFWLKCSADLGYGPAQLAYANYPFLTEDEARTLTDSALGWYETHAEAGDAESQYQYSLLLLRDDSDWCGDPERGLEWLKASAEQDYGPACRRLGQEYFRGGISDFSTERGIYWLSRYADIDDPWACEMLGDLYLLGHEHGMYAMRDGNVPPQRITPDQKAAITWYERGIAAAPLAAGRALAFKLGKLYLTGEHLDQDLPLAEQWLAYAAEHGYGPAHELLGDEYLSGTRLRRRVETGIYSLQAAGVSSVSARLKLAEIYLDGKITPPNFDMALDWLNRDPDRTGRKNKQMKLLAEKCVVGRLGATEAIRARTWLEQMAQETIVRATTAEPPFAAGLYYDIAQIHEFGLGVARDMDAALDWYQRAADEGLYAAKRRLNDLYQSKQTP